MATRTRTALFLQYRNTFQQTKPRLGSNSMDNNERATLLNSNEPINDTVLELTNLPPKWVDIMDEIEEDFSAIKSNINQLETLHKKNAIPGFNDTQNEEQSIQSLTDQISTGFHKCQQKIKRLNLESKNSEYKQGQQVGKNIQIALATKLQDLSTAFRKSQSSYLQKLRGRESKNRNMFAADETDDELDAVFTDAQLQTVASNEREITAREQGINEIVKSINGLSTIFKELQTMVIDQGTILDRIDYNIEQVGIHVEGAHEELVKAHKYQSNKMGKYCIIVLGVIVAILFLVVLLKPKKK